MPRYFGRSRTKTNIFFWLCKKVFIYNLQTSMRKVSKEKLSTRVNDLLLRKFGKKEDMRNIEEK